VSPKPDPLAQAIAAANGVDLEATPGVRVQFRLVGGRPVVLTVPHGMSDSEWLSLIANLIPLRDQLRAAPPSPIEPVRALPQVRPT
jgi:hypothetical protein